MTKPFDLLVAGEINPDLILSDPHLTPHFGQQEDLVQDATLCIGSSSAIFACGAARLGLKTAIIGVVGEDIFGRFMRDALSARQVDVSQVIVDPARATGLSVILNRMGDRAILTFLGAMAALRAEDVHDDLLRQARHLHVASYFLQYALQPGLPDLFRRARALGLTTSLDTNWDPSGKWAGIDDLLALTDVFFPNENEALALTHAASVTEALAQLSRRCRVVALKLGAQGGMAQQGSEVAIAKPAIAVQVADTVGAGDSFDSGFLYGFLQGAGSRSIPGQRAGSRSASRPGQGWSLARSLALGVACGSLSTRRYGGTTAQATLEEALTCLGVDIPDTSLTPNRWVGK